MDTIFSDMHIRVVGAQRTVLPEKYWERPLECDPFARFYVVNAGTGMTRVEGTLKRFTPDGIYIIPSHTEFQHVDSPGMDHYWIHFQALLPSGLSLFEVLDSDWEIPCGAIPDSAEKADRIVRLYNGSSFLDIIEARSILAEMVCQFLRASKTAWKTKPKDIQRFEPVLRYIEEHLTTQLTVDDLAGICHLQPQYFSEVFSRSFGQPPLRFVNQKRMERAQFFLVNSTISVKEIAHDLGYEDECYFSRMFKRLVGMNPTEYRKKRTLLAHRARPLDL